MNCKRVTARRRCPSTSYEYRDHYKSWTFRSGIKIRMYLLRAFCWKDTATLDKLLKRIIDGMPARYRRRPRRYRVSVQHYQRHQEVLQVCDDFFYFEKKKKEVWVTLSFCLGGVLTSPSPTHYAFSRWSTSRLNSGTNSSSTSPCGSARSSFNYRQPYLGWRSQEKLSKPRTPAERLAAGLLPQYQVGNFTFSKRLSVGNFTKTRLFFK